MHDEKLSPREATKKSMRQITGALVGVVLVISAVFVPMAFMGGSTGVIYRQFSVTIVAAMVISLLIALVLTPTMCAGILKHSGPSAREGLFGRFNRWFEWATLRYQSIVRHMLHRPKRYLIAFGAGLVVVALLFTRIPSAFLPDEDQGILMAGVQLPPGATFERTWEVMDQFRGYFEENEPNVDAIMTVSGFSFAGSVQNAGMAFLRMKDWDEREGKDSGVFSLINRANAFMQGIPEAQIFVMAPPAIVELGTSGGFDLQLIDRAGQGHDALMSARMQLLGAAARHPALAAVRPNGLDDVEQYELEINLPKAGSMGLNKAEINTALAAYWGSQYVNDFMDSGRTKKVFIQAEPSCRMQPSDFDRYYIRNATGEMVPFSSFMSVRSTHGSPRLERYQGFPSVEILGGAAPGQSSGQAMEIMEELARDLPPGFELAWTGMSFQEKQAGSQAFFLYGISLLVVFLCLAALYESWSVPFSVLLAVPTGVIGAVSGVFLRGMSNDIYFQIGLLTIVGLSAKNSILIVEFAKSLHEQGMELVEAACEAARLRLRPIIMTSLAFILGVVPLAVSSGAGSGGQNALGTTVVAGMLTATGLGIFLTPLFFVLVTRLFAKKGAGARTPAQGASHA
jgi:multidrug efflux pump